MGVFKLGKMTFGSLFKKPETVLYPIEKKPQPMGLKGHIVLDADTCILCGMCERGCPTDCISVDKAKRTWSLQPYQCIQCGYCTRVCPKSCLTMDPNYWTAAVEKIATVVEVPEKAKPEGAAKQKAAVVKSEPASSAAVTEKIVDTVKTEVAAVKTDVESGDRAASSKPVDHELEAKIALMDEAAAARVREALAKR